MSTQRTDYLLVRLERLIRLRVQYRHEVNAVGIRLLDRSIRAATIDLQDVGRAEEAGERLHGLCVALASGWVE